MPLASSRAASLRSVVWRSAMATPPTVKPAGGEADRLRERERIADAGGGPADDGQEAGPVTARGLVEPRLPAALVHFAHAFVSDRRAAGARGEQRRVAARIDRPREGEGPRHRGAARFV